MHIEYRNDQRNCAQKSTVKAVHSSMQREKQVGTVKMIPLEFKNTPLSPREPSKKSEKLRKTWNFKKVGSKWQRLQIRIRKIAKEILRILIENCKLDKR